MKRLEACSHTPGCLGGMRIVDSRTTGLRLTQYRKCAVCDERDKRVHQLNVAGHIISNADTTQ